MLGAIEEILLRHRALVDDAIRPLQENTPIDEFLKDIEARVVALQDQEPSFWELRVVEYIHHVVQSELKSKLRLQSEDEKQQTLETDVKAVEEQIEASAREQLRRLLDVLDNSERPNDVPNRGRKQAKEHFLEIFWRNVTQFAETTNQIDAMDENEAEDDGALDTDDAPDVMSYEAITFDELQSETGSVNSAPSTEELPMILEAFTDHRFEERKDALRRLSRIPTIELVHCPAQFQSLMDGLLSLLLDDDSNIPGDAMRLIYCILDHTDDSMHFATIYLSTIEMVGSRVASGALAIETSELFTGRDHGNKVVNVFRLLLLVINRAPYHWIHFPQEMLVRILCSTFIVLMLEPSTSSKKSCRPLDVLATLDADAAWLTKWTAKIPSRAQLFVSIDECGLLSDIMYAMTRVRPFESEMDGFEKMKVANMLTILANLACYRPGRDLLFGWTKLPAHMQQQRRFTSWYGSEKQFRLETLPSENDRLYHFHRTDREMRHATSIELEDCKPLEEQALEGIVLSAIVAYFFEDRESHWLESCAASAYRVIRFLQTRDDFLTLLFELVIQCNESVSGESVVIRGEPNEEREECDPWFPFRRPRAPEAVIKFMSDSMTKRLARGLLNPQTVCRRCIRVLDGLFESASTLGSLPAPLVSVLAKATLVRLATGDSTAGLPIGKEFFERLQKILEISPYVLTTLLCESATDFLPQLALQLSKTTDQATRSSLLQLLLSLAQYSSAIHELNASGLWRDLLEGSLRNWRAEDSFDPKILRLLSITAAATAFFDNPEGHALLYEMQQACNLDLDFALALNAPPQEAPYRLRRFAQSIAWLRAAFASQHASLIFTARDNNKWIAFLEETITMHKQDVCRASPQREDSCTMAFKMLTALAGCVPSTVGLYGLLLHSGFQSLEPEEDGGISACSVLAASLSTSLDHVGASLQAWIRPQPLFAFQGPMYEPDGDLLQGDTPTGQPTTFTASMTGALEHMLASIAESNRQDTPLDLSMLSQATWELIGDIENCALHPTSDSSWDASVLARAFGKLIFELAKSGRSKLSEGARGGSTDNDTAALPSSAPAFFPTDAERKLMNRYYKDYCARLGLKASPTTLHVLTKIFGKAATDCFAITMLMVLDQVYGEQDVINVLQICATCPSIFVLWPRITEASTKQLQDVEDGLSPLVSLAQAAEMVLEIEFPQIFTTLRQCHCSVLTLILRWHSQCFWNFLSWDKLVIMVYLNFLYGAEFQVYLFVAALRHMEPTIRLIITRNGPDTARAFVEVLQAPISGFQFSTARNLFLRLRSTYHDRITQILQQPALLLDKR